LYSGFLLFHLHFNCSFSSPFSSFYFIIYFHIPFFHPHVHRVWYFNFYGCILYVLAGMSQAQLCGGELRWLSQQGKPYGVPPELIGLAVQSLRIDCLVLPAAYR
jgi:hypothetical protein